MKLLNNENWYKLHNVIASIYILPVIVDRMAERGRGWVGVMPSFFVSDRERWNSPYINHFISADTIVSSYANPQTLNRYSYVSNNPIRYIDPTGHSMSMGCGDDGKAACPHGNGNTPGNAGNCSGSSCHGNDDKDDEEDANANNCHPGNTSCAVVSDLELETYLNNTWHTYQGSLWAGALVLASTGGVALGLCIPSGGLACVVGIVLIGEAVELTYEANEAGDISSYLHNELGALNPGDETIISLDYSDSDSTFAELNASNTSYGQNIDFPINSLILQLSINHWNTGQIVTIPSGFTP